MKVIYLLAISLFCCSTRALAQGTLDSGLIRDYPFNGNADDASGFGYHATVTGATLTEDRFGKSNKAYMFDGVDDRINFDPTGCDQPEFSYSVWVKMKYDSSKNNGVGVYALMYIGNSTYNDHGMSTGGSGTQWTIGSYHTDGTLTNVLSGVQPVAEIWHHLVLTRDSDSVILYLNGNKIGSSSVGGKAAGWMGTNYGVIGARPSYSYFFRGAMDEARVYGRAISPAEVASLFNTQNTAPTGNAELVKTDVVVFPNPISPGMTLHVQSMESFGDNARIQLYSLCGQEVFQSEFYGSVEIPELAAGTYLMIISSDSAILRKRIELNSK